MSDKSGSKFSLGLVLGVVGGALAAFFLTPTTGEENRKKAMEAFHKIKKMAEEGELEDKVYEVFGEVTDEGTRLYEESRKELISRLGSLKGQVDSLDKEKFTQFVDEVVSKVSANVTYGAHYLEKLKASMLAKWETEDKKTEKAKKVLKPRIRAEKVAMDM